MDVGIPGTASGGRFRLAAVRVRAIWSDQTAARRETIRWVSVLLLATVLFYWRILLMRQFSLLTEWEGVAQQYSWLTFWVTNIRHGILPVWDPYTFGGHSFIGEMQTGGLYPFHLLLALFPLNRNFLFSPALYHFWFVFTHFLGAYFMFRLVREFKLSGFASFLAAICFSFGGFVGRVPWPDRFEGGIWLPLLFLFFLRALNAPEISTTITRAAVAGLMLGFSILAGGMHMAFQQTLFVVAAGAYYLFAPEPNKEPLAWYRRPGLRRAILTVTVIGFVGFAAGAVQLLPSIEYSHHSFRFLGASGPLPADQKIPYDDLSDRLWPRSLLAMLIPYAFNGTFGSGEVSNPYIGVFPLLLAILGIWSNWAHRWVRYLTGLAVAAFLYSLGSFSPLHGLLYAIVPWLWMAREASRTVYLMDFALCILAAFGIDALLSSECRAVLSKTWNRILAGVVIACAASLFVPAVFGRPEINTWVEFSFVLIFLSYALYQHIARGNAGRGARVLITGLVLFDLSAFDWSARNLLETSRTGINHLDRLLSTRDAVAFLRSQPGPFRVEIPIALPPNIGDAFAIATTSGAGATMTHDFAMLNGHPELLNVGFRLMPSSTSEPGAVYQDKAWKIYKKADALPRAWIVHETVVELSPENALMRLTSLGFDPARIAVLDSPVEIEPLRNGALESVAYSAAESGRVEMNVVTATKGVVVVSEMYYPGWQARVNGQPTHIYRADAGLRGIRVPAGKSRITLEYSPITVYVGGTLTFVAFFGTWISGYYLDRRKRFG